MFKFIGRWFSKVGVVVKAVRLFVEKYKDLYFFTEVVVGEIEALREVVDYKYETAFVAIVEEAERRGIFTADKVINLLIELAVLLLD